MKFDDLIKRLRDMATSDNNIKSNYIGLSLLQAANAIEELSKLLDEETEYATALACNVLQWIPVTERLPDMHVEVLVCTEDYGKTELGFLTDAVWDGAGWLETWERKTYLATVTHWMPLPEPPKEET